MKNKFTKELNPEWLIITILWLALVISPVLIFQNDGEVVWRDVYRLWRGLIPFFILFLINHFLLVPFFLFRNKTSRYLLSALILVGIFAYSTNALVRNHEIRPPIPGEIHSEAPSLRHFGPPPGPPEPRDPRNPISFPPIISTIILSVLILGFDTGLRIIVRNSRIEQEKLTLEKENIHNQLAFLRNQVSPHFFMNTLNNIHALIDLNKEEAKEAIIRLSKLMRHLLYESENDRVSLIKELDFIRSYIRLMKLRYSDKINIQLKIDDAIPDKKIPPLLFTSFVENAFKYGISYQHASSIDITFSVINNQLHFRIRNDHNDRKSAVEDSGIGIANARKRLNLLFGDRYDLKIEDKENEFIVQLIIPV